MPVTNQTRHLIQASEDGKTWVTLRSQAEALPEVSEMASAMWRHIRFVTRVIVTTDTETARWRDGVLVGADASDPA